MISQPWMLQPHRRFNPLAREWVLVSPQRTSRPWQGQVEETAKAASVPYDPTCYLCPGNPRAGGVRNPDYKSTFVFDNDFPALLPVSVGGSFEDGLLVGASERGICRVVCFSPRHDLAVPDMAAEELDAVVEVWAEQSVSLMQLPFVKYVQIFENRGAMMGASNPHPHCQIWSGESIPNELVKEDAAQMAYWSEHHACLLCRYCNTERGRERLVCENASFLAVVPFWAVWPFEVLVMATGHVDRMDRLLPAERRDLGDILKQVTRKYDALFGVPFPYTMGFHQRPKGNSDAAAWHLHAHYYPPLLRSATVRKFMVGYELLANPQRDLTAEQAAERLREVG